MALTGKGKDPGCVNANCCPQGKTCTEENEMALTSRKPGRPAAAGLVIHVDILLDVVEVYLGPRLLPVSGRHSHAFPRQACTEFLGLPTSSVGH